MFARQSLITRHLLASAFLLPLLLGFSAFALDRAFRESLLSAEGEALKAQLYALLGAAEPDGETLFLPEVLAEPRFNSPESGLYAKVTNVYGLTVWQSNSLTVSDLHLATDANLEIESGEGLFDQIDIGAQRYFRFIYDTIWEINEKDRYFRFYVLHSSEALDQELNIYRNTLWLWLGALAVLIVLAQTIIVHWGFRPLNRLATQLRLFQEGETTYLKGRYPREIEPITTNLNLLLESERKQRKKYKNTLSDLAHSLKTPLAIIRSNIHTGDDAAIEEQLERMANIIDHQLRRATTLSTDLNRVSTNLCAIVDRLGKALLKVYTDKGIKFENTVDTDCDFVGDENDLMEMLGNIIENAFKYGDSRVLVSSELQKKSVTLIIEDDGKGIPEEKRPYILHRGARADTVTAGQGIGLAVSIDIISSYNGSLEVAQSRWGGAAFRISLPHRHKHE